MVGGCVRNFEKPGTAQFSIQDQLQALASLGDVKYRPRPPRSPRTRLLIDHGPSSCLHTLLSPHHHLARPAPSRPSHHRARRTAPSRRFSPSPNALPINLISFHLYCSSLCAVPPNNLDPMASGTPSAHKRSSLHRLSHTILSLAAPSFSRVSFDAQGFGSRRRISPLKTHAPSVATTSSLDKHDGQSAYSPSILSAVDSQLSSPYTPLLPSSPASPPLVDPAAVPPTTNDLSEEEKMKLMRKVRKLSRVLGEIPAVEEEETEPSGQRANEALDGLRPASPGASKRQAASASVRKSWRRSLTFAASTSSAMLEARDVRHARSLSALRPSLSLPRASPVSDTFAAPSSPITFARPESAMSHRDVSECGLSSSAPEPQGRDFHGLRRRDSTASSVLLADQNVEQVQRTRAAKLSRHFGTNIPPEVLLRAASPPPPASPLALYPLPAPVLSAEELPRRSTSLRRRPKRPRPASLDIRPSSGLFSAPTSPLGSPLQKSEGTRTLKRSKSLWSKRPKTADGSENISRNANDDVDVIASGLSEKQRIQNVKRAKKMAQVRVLPCCR